MAVVNCPSVLLGHNTTRGLLGSCMPLYSPLLTAMYPAPSHWIAEGYPDCWVSSVCSSSSTVMSTHPHYQQGAGPLWTARTANACLVLFRCPRWFSAFWFCDRLRVAAAGHALWYGFVLGKICFQKSFQCIWRPTWWSLRSKPAGEVACHAR